MADICSNESLYQFLAQSFISFYPLTENPLKRHFCGFLAALSVSIFHSWSLKKLTIVTDLDFLSWKRSKIWEMCICTTKDGVKKLVAPMDELKRPSQLFSSTHYTKMVQTTQPMVYIVKPFSNSTSLVATAILVTGYTRGWRQCSITAVSKI